MPKRKAVRAVAPLISEETFHAIAVMANRLICISEEECHVAPIAMLILWHVRHFGKKYGDQSCILRHDLTRMLKEKFRYTDGDISKILAKLQNDGFILRAAVSDKERMDLFRAPGDTRVVIINEKGNEKIEEFKCILRQHTQEWLSGELVTTRFAVQAVLPAVEKLAKWFVKRYEPENLSQYFNQPEGRCLSLDVRRAHFVDTLGFGIKCRPRFFASG